MLLNTKETRFELIVFLILIIVSWVGHYYLSWHYAFTSIWGHILKFAWMLLMVIIGYIGLTKHEIASVKYIWALIYTVLLIGFVFDKILQFYFHQPLIFNIPSYQFTSPLPYLVACILPRIIKSQLKQARKTN